MSTPELTIAQAALSASLFRADPTPIGRPQVDAFFPLLTSTLAQCSRPNVQKCKVWIVDNVARSRARAAALAKFFMALSKSLGVVADGKRPSVRRRRLHLLYVVSDVLYPVMGRQKDREFGAVWEAVLPGLFAHAAAFHNSPKQMKKLEDLVAIWEEQVYFTPAFTDQLREAIENGTAVDTTTNPEPSDSIKVAKKAPYTLPSFHGDPSTPWYDLPAGTWLPHLTPNSTKPMVPDQIKPIQLVSGPASKALATAVQTLLSDAERIFSKEKPAEDDLLTDLNELGERVVLDEISGDVISAETYYGWSRQFCEQMRSRKKKAATGPERGRSESKSGYRSSDHSRSSSPRSPKRRRMASTSRSRSRSPRRGNGSYSRSRSPGRPRHGRSYSRSVSRSPSPRPRLGASPQAAPRPGSWQQGQHSNNAPPPIPPQRGFLPGAPPGLGNFPVPPPPPPAGYSGPWPPPLPPQMHQGPQQGWLPNQNPPPPPPYAMGGWAPGPPPPPPPPQQHQQMPPQNNHYGRGNGTYRGRGRGGYDHGNSGRGW